MDDVFARDLIITLRTYEENWDSYGGHPPTEAAIEALSRFQVIPRSSGGLLINLDLAGWELEVEIDDDGSFGAVAWGRSTV